MSSVLVREASSPARRRAPASAHWRSVALGVAGLAATLALWWLAVTLVVGVPLGFAIGRLRWLEQTLSPTLQFLRMISPLAWMPLAVMSLGVGDRAVYFLLAFAAVWPLVMSTASGVAHLDQRWIQLGESLAATRAEMLWHIHVPGVAAHVLTGVRLAIGIL
ncbi:NitT/TauT family transport system permease protein [Paraburkholderia atlantica]